MYYTIHQLNNRIFAVDSDSEIESYILESLPGVVTLASYLSVSESCNIFDTFRALGYTDATEQKKPPACIVTRGQLFKPATLTGVL